MAVGTAAAVIGLLGTITSLIFQGVGAKEEREQTQSINKKLGQQRAEEMTESRRRFDVGTAQRQEEFRAVERERAKKWKWDEEQRDYRRAWDFTRNLRDLLDRDQASKNRLVSIWNRGR